MLDPVLDFRGFFSAILINRRIASGRDSSSLSRDNQSSTAASSSGGSLTPTCGAPLPSPPSYSVGRRVFFCYQLLHFP